ncbi:aldo/keto reductase [Tetragenococcus muriaticus]|uniref:aldo/keto reductase n=1 Tax=Tetragenococcus muriaticus TaxID=64642 RepID=UPI0003FF6FA5|nr:aldo/keto reductase [Tetragenococcus muriaticus]GMA45963.1 oxidoreductase [Tetragenococcus muriaticus]GMA46091.1 oxidoreductase [Tetragenococcus muriaticus]GMA46101.1 oxidoreductase [Tetragenococcus muriaticus]GMA46111.1 oxidoreductase [Tetragenococcus muriaticus]GMA46248.1 oxidoreductase [Tetragenococcus muriaticus]
MTLYDKFYLNDGTTLPHVGLGTVHIQGGKGIHQVHSALDVGYRVLDTATGYNNEGMVGEAVRRSSIPREQLYVSDKLPGLAQRYDKAIDLIQETLYRTKLDYFDKYLIHWPNPQEGLYVEAWQALVDAQEYGLIKTIGVSNFLPEHLDNIIEATGVTPATNQIERHPYFNNKELVKENDKRGILSEAWSPFGREINDTLTNNTIKEIAEKYDRSPAQIILNWNNQSRVFPVVRSADQKHQSDNFHYLDFELAQEDLEKIDALGRGEQGRIEGQNPNEYEEFT